MLYEVITACREEARAKKYVATLLGRRCAIPEIDSSNGAVRSYAERNAINYPIQGLGIDPSIRAGTEQFEHGEVSFERGLLKPGHSA